MYCQNNRISRLTIAYIQHKEEKMLKEELENFEAVVKKEYSEYKTDRNRFYSNHFSYAYYCSNE